MIAYCKKCRQKVEIEDHKIAEGGIIACPKCNNNIETSKHKKFKPKYGFKDQTTLVVDPEEFAFEKRIWTFRSIIKCLLGLFVFLLLIIAVLYFHPKTQNYTRASLLDVYDQIDSYFTGKKYIKRKAIILYEEADKLFYENSYASLKEAGLLYQKAYKVDKEYNEALEKIIEVYTLIGTFSNDPRLLRKSSEYLERFKDKITNNAFINRIQSNNLISKLRVDYYIEADTDAKGIKAAYLQALEKIDEAIKLEPENPYNYNDKGMILIINSKEDEQTIECFKTAINKANALLTKDNAANGQYLSPIFNMALLYFLQNNFEKAGENIELVLKLNPKLERARVLDEIIKNEQTLNTLNKKPAGPKDALTKEVTYSNDLMFDYINSFTAVRKGISDKNVL